MIDWIVLVASSIRANLLGSDDAAGDAKRLGRHELANDQPVERDLDAMVGLVTAAGLALDQP
jgi:hypothetical protein